MSEANNPPAFPIPIAGDVSGHIYNTLEQSGGELGGMTLRDYFAAAVLPALIANYDHLADHEIAVAAYNVADAMLEERDIAKAEGRS